MVKWHAYGELAQMVERSLCMREVGGSIPSFSISFFHPHSTLLFCLLSRSPMNRFSHIIILHLFTGTAVRAQVIAQCTWMRCREKKLDTLQVADENIVPSLLASSYNTLVLNPKPNILRNNQHGS